MAYGMDEEEKKKKTYTLEESIQRRQQLEAQRPPKSAGSAPSATQQESAAPRKTYTLEESTARRQRMEAQQYQQKKTQGTQDAQKTTRMTIDLAQHKPEDIAALGYRMSGQDRQNFLNFAQGYYKKTGAGGQLKDEEITSQWDAWDAQAASAQENRRITSAQDAFARSLGEKGVMSRMDALSVMAGMSDEGEKAAAQQSYAALTGTKGSAYYQPYSKATSAALSTLGVDAVDDAWFAGNAGMENDLLLDPYTGKVQKPGNSATQAQKNAYAMYILKGNEQTTKDAEEEREALYAQIASAAGRKGFDAASEIEGIDWKEYPTLKKMLDGAQTGEVVQLNRAVPFSMEALYGVAYCAQNGIEPTDAREYELYAGAWVNEMKRQAAIGTQDEEPVGFFSSIWDGISGGKADREARKAQAQSARDTLKALGLATEEEPEHTQGMENEQKGTQDGAEVHDGESHREEEKNEEKAKSGGVEGIQEESDAKAAEERGEKATPTSWVPGLNAQEQEEAQPSAQVQSVQKTTPTGWMKARTQESEVLEFRKGSYSFVESAQDRNTLKRIDKQIALLEQEKSTLGESRRRSMDTSRASQIQSAQEGTAWKERLAQVNEQIGRLNAKKLRIAFGGTGETQPGTNLQERRRITPETAQDVMARTGELATERAGREEQEAGESQNMTPPVGFGTTAYRMWLEAGTDGYEAIYDAYNRRVESAKESDDSDWTLDELMAAEYEKDRALQAQQMRQSVLEKLIPTDGETQAMYEAAGEERMSLLLEREVQSALGNDAAVEEITGQLLEAGYPACWPEEEEAQAQERAEAIEYAQGWGEDAVRARLGITDGRELTEDDYYQAAHTDKSFWEWEFFGGWKQLGDKEKTQATAKALASALTGKNAQTAGTEDVLEGYAGAIIGSDAGIEQKEAVKDVVSAGLAIEGGAIRAGASAVQGAADMLEAMWYEAARGQYGRNLTRAQAAIFSPEYQMARDAKQAMDAGVDTVAPDVSGRSAWVQTIGSLSESVTQNIIFAQAGNAAGKLGTRAMQMLGVKDAAMLNRAYQRASSLVRNAGFTFSGFKSGMAEANAAGLENEDAILYAALSAGISMGVENLNIDPFTQAAQGMAMLPDKADAAKKGLRKALDLYGEDILKSAAGEGLEEVVEDPLQATLQKIMIDPEMKIFGEGGVIDLGRAAQAGAMGAIAGAILSGAAMIETAETTAKTKQPKTQEQQPQAGNQQEQTQEQKTKETSPAPPTAPTRVEAIKRKAQDLQEIAEAVKEMDSRETKGAVIQAPRELEANGQISDDTRTNLKAEVETEKLRRKLIEQDMSMAAAALGSEITSEQTKRIAEKSIEEIMGIGGQIGNQLSKQAREALWQATARDIARAQAQQPVQQARTELGKAQTDLKAVKKEYGQMTGRLNALTDNATQIMNRMLGGQITKEESSEYQSILSKVNSLRKRIENQKERMQDAQRRVKDAQGVLEAAQKQAAADEESAYAQMVSATPEAFIQKTVQTTHQASGEQAQTQTQGTQQAQAVPNEAEAADRATMAALADGNGEAALAIQKAKAKAQSEAAAEQTQAAQSAAQEEEKRIPEVWDRFEDYDVKGLRKYLSDTLLYVDEAQAAEIRHRMGAKSVTNAAMQLGVKVTTQKGKGIPIDTAWSDIGQYMGDLAAPDEAHPEVRLMEIMRAIRENEAEMRDPKNRYLSARTRKKRANAGKTADGKHKTAQQIVEELRKAFPTASVRSGSRFYNLKIESGNTDIGSGSIRIAGSRNVADMAHEIGHALSIRGGINDAQRTAAGRVIPDSVKVAEKYRTGVDAMVDRMAAEDPGTFRHAAYREQEAKRQDALAEFWTKLIEQGEDAARAFAGDELYDQLIALPTKEEMAALRQAGEDYRALAARTLFEEGTESVVTEENARRRELKAAAGSPSRDLIAMAVDKNTGWMLWDKAKLESIKSTMSPEEWKAFVKENKKAGRTNLAAMTKEQREAYIKTGKTDVAEDEQIYVRSANREKARGVVSFFIDTAIVARDGRVLMDEGISKIVAPIHKDEVEKFGSYNMLLQELDARNLREAHMAAYAARKAQAPERWKNAKAAWSEASKEVKRAQAAALLYRGRTDAGGQASYRQAQERVAEAAEEQTAAKREMLDAKKELEETAGDYKPQANDAYNTAWADRTKGEIEEEIRRVEKEFPAFKGVHEKLCRAYKLVMEDQLIKPGYVENAEKAWANVTQARPHYLPTRVVQTQTSQEQQKTQGTTKSEKTVRSASAGDRDVIDPIATTVSELDRIVRARVDMELKAAMASDYDTYEGMGQFLREITSTEDIGEIEKTLATGAGETGMNKETMSEKQLLALQEGGVQVGDRRVMIAINGGKKRYFEVTNQTIYNALEGAGSVTQMRTQEIGIVKVLKATGRAINNVFRATTTLVHPFFGLKNTAKDAATAAVMGQQATHKDAISGYLGAMAESFRYNFTGKIKAGSDLYQFAAMGGLEGDAYSHDVEGAREKQKNLFRGQYDAERNAISRLVSKAWEEIENFNDSTEAGMRYYQFKQGLKLGQSAQRAFRMSQEATTDFSRTGFKTRAVGQYFYFFNAAIQDTYGLVHAMEQNEFEPGRAERILTRAMVRATVAGIAGELLRELFWSDEDKEKYDAMADIVKRENWVLWFWPGTSKAFILPKGENVLFSIGDIPRSLIAGMNKEIRNGGDWRSYIRHELSRDAAAGVEAVIDSVNPFGSSVFQTAIDLATNTNHWGDAIIPEYLGGSAAMFGADAYAATDARTSEVARALSALTGGMISPKAIHYAIDQQFGWVGDLVLNLTTPSKTGRTFEESGLGEYLMGMLADVVPTLAQMAAKGFTSNVSVINDTRSDFYEYRDFFSDTIDQQERTDGNAWMMRDRMSLSLSEKERARGIDDAKDMKKYLTNAAKAVQKLNKDLDAHPEDAEAIEQSIMQILMVSNQAAQSWQRRYMDGDLDVVVRIPGTN